MALAQQKLTQYQELQKLKSPISTPSNSNNTSSTLLNGKPMTKPLRKPSKVVFNIYMNNHKKLFVFFL